ncbi:MAG TPA: biotin/lipoate A/B protein ligase family protein [Thermomicrobiales bacterium]|jgi:lipoate-protein ligase A|nr:biotin/lipoate A/B protein ligase family protein [Thermomicrobiales bacterium]
MSDLSRWRYDPWVLLPIEPATPAMNLALDEELTLRVGADERPPTLRFWSWTASCIVLGRFQSVRNEVQEENARARGVEIVRRISGGGAMFIEPEGAITYSLYAPAEMAAGMSFAESYAFFDSWVISALRSLGIDAWYAPLNDITSAGGKIGGAAQARRGGAILHHTTMAYQMNIPAMMEVLRIGQEKLSDKGIRSADKRVGPLRQQTDLPRQQIIDHLIAEFGNLTDLRESTLSDDERAGAETRVRERFGTDAWRYILP